MKILAVDTSSKAASAALVEDDKLICEITLNNKLTHSQTILPIIDDVLKRGEVSPAEVDLFAVSSGPGSFTGLRIGVTTVKGLAHAVNKPVVSVSTLEALAYNLPACPYIIAPIMDARREQVYNALYRFDDNHCIKEIAAPRAISLSECIEEVKGYKERTVFLGDGVNVFRNQILSALGDTAYIAPQNVCEQHAAAVAEAAKHKESIHYSELVPVYLRKSQAEREKEEREKIR